MARLAADDIAELDPYRFMAVIGKRVIHPGGRASTESLLARAGITEGSRVLDVGCGVATTAIEIARRFGAQVTAVDISALMLERAADNVRAAGVADRVTVAHGDILGLDVADAVFDVVIAEAVMMFVDRRRAAAELVRVAKPGGRVLATEFFWRSRPSEDAKGIFLGQVLSRAGVRHGRGLGPDLRGRRPQCHRDRDRSVRDDDASGFLADEGVARTLGIMGRVAIRPAHVRKMVWLMPRMARAVPFLGYIVVAATKPLQRRRRTRPTELASGSVAPVNQRTQLTKGEYPCLEKPS